MNRNVLSPPAEIVTNLDSSSSTTGSVSKESPSDLLPVRRSTRDIKRKKYDDEYFVTTGLPLKSPLKRQQRLSISEKPAVEQKALIVESPSTVSTIPPLPVIDTTQLPSPTLASLTPRRHSINVASLSSVAAASSTAPLPLVVNPPAVYSSSTTPKKRGRQPKKPLPPTSSVLANPIEVQERVAALKDIGRWQPVDDLALITAVMQTNDLTCVYTGIKFSCKFSLAEIQARWYSLLYDPIISKLAQDAMKQLTPEVISSIQSNTLFSSDEEKCLAAIPSTGASPTIETFEQLLDKYPDVFHFARTSRCLFAHWQNMREYRLLNDQRPISSALANHANTFSDIEADFATDGDPQDPADSVVDRELHLTERHLTREMRQLENELPKWHVLVESVTGVAPAEFDTSTVAALRGRLVRYLIKTREVVFGRNAKGNTVDIDLSLEGPVYKVSRKQGTIKLRTTGDFYIANDGKRPIYVDGKPVLTNSKMKLNNNAVIEISCIRMIFVVNQDLISVMRSEGTKMMLA